MKRREFLFGSLASVFYLACGSSTGGDTPSSGTDTTTPPGGGQAPGADGAAPLTPTSSPEASDAFFPQGLASGDPRPDRVLLWTRIDPTGAGKSASESIDVTLVIAEDEALTKVVGQTTVAATADSDHTVRIVSTDLKPGQHYYYRFESAGTTTRVGRTKTAPDPNTDVGVKFAFCSCQDYIGRYWHSWKALLDEKADLDFILWLGDYIYETVNDPKFQSTTPDRAIKLPNGMDTSAAQDGSQLAALTLDDYRTLYKTYRSDPLLREVHRLYPFILTWDDHEFANDCWQDHSTYFNELDPVTKGFTDEKNTPRRHAANRAFFEYQPADITFDDKTPFPNDIKLYRQLRYGKHVDIFMTDQRMYRSDHVIPEGPTDYSVGKLTKNTLVGSRNFVRKSAFDPKEAEALPTMLGSTQKAWFIDAVKKSNATWKVWGNEVQMYQMALRLGDLPGIPGFFSYTAYISCDQWDGYRSERREILDALSSAGVENLVVCTGDIHAFFAAELHVDFDSPQPKPVGVEYVTAGISSASLSEIVDKQIPSSSPLRPVADFFVNGADGAIQASNPHLRYSDSTSYGFALVDIDGLRTQVEFVELGDPREKTSPGVVSRHKFVTTRFTNTITPL